MQKYFEKIINRLEDAKGIAFLTLANTGDKTKDVVYDEVLVYMNTAIKIVNQVAEECKDRIFINGQCCWQSCACTEKCQECNRYTLSDADIDWYESIEDWDDEFGRDINVGNRKLLDSLHEKILKSKFAEEVTEAEIEALVNAIGKDTNAGRNDGWIPVLEWLPDEKGEYYVTYHPCYWDHVYDEVCVGLDTFRGKASWAKKKYQRVIAWKPKDTPYQPKGE